MFPILNFETTRNNVKGQITTYFWDGGIGSITVRHAPDMISKPIIISFDGNKILKGRTELSNSLLSLFSFFFFVH